MQPESLRIKKSSFGFPQLGLLAVRIKACLKIILYLNYYVINEILHIQQKFLKHIKKSIYKMYVDA